MYKNKKHLFFDMDDTVTLTRSLMEDDIYEFYASLKHDLIIVSGAHVAQITAQVRGLPFYKLGQNGNQAINPASELLWEEKLLNEHTEKITDHIQKMQRLCEHAIQNTNDLIEHRGAQISYSLIGHNEAVSRKRSFDPEQIIRKDLLKKIPFNHDDIEVKIGGTTCFDYFQKGKNKGYNVKKLIDFMGWDKDEALYFGDALYPGGNDETVIGIIDTVQVENHRHTHELLKMHFDNKL
jgi:HAD superfamily hydrolase (TIGR01484 family)